MDGVAGGTVVTVEGDVPVDAQARFEAIVERVEQPLRRISGRPGVMLISDNPQLPLLHGEATLIDDPAGTLVVFACGEITWTLTWLEQGRAEVDSMLLLAEMLVPHLYCTLPPR